MLKHCHGPTIDLGCGPGRLVQALTARGVRALGIDTSPWAVRQCRGHRAFGDRAARCRPVAWSRTPAGPHGQHRLMVSLGRRRRRRPARTGRGLRTAREQDL
nr:class I SAM-dependent methyltransferase [Actinoallomurus bryophytorum]